MVPLQQRLVVWSVWCVGHLVCGVWCVQAPALLGGCAGVVAGQQYACRHLSPGSNSKAQQLPLRASRGSTWGALLLPVWVCREVLLAAAALCSCMCMSMVGPCPSPACFGSPGVTRWVTRGSPEWVDWREGLCCTYQQGNCCKWWAGLGWFQAVPTW
jgi:hypothetical protein